MAITANSAMRTPNTLATLVPVGPLAPLAAWIALAWPAPAPAAEWTIKPSIDVRETYSDNLTLAPTGSEQSGFITELAPHLGIEAKGARMSLSADYTLHYFDYTRAARGSSLQHDLRAAGHGELLEELFFIDADASSTQQSVSAFAPRVNDRGDVTGNQADVRTYRISPYLRHRFGRAATGEARYTHDAVRTDEGGLSDSKANAVHIGIASGADFRRVQWNLALDDQKIDYENTDDVETRALSGGVRYLVTPRFALTGSGGYEDNTYLSIGKKPEGSFWALGFSWMPSERTSIAASAGRRFFGNTFSLNAQHRTRIAVWNASYQEEISTARSQFLTPTIQNTADFLSGLWKNSIPDDKQRGEVVNQFIRETDLPDTVVVPVNSFTNRVFLQKAAQASVALKGVRNTVITSIFRVEREPQSVSAADLAISAAGGILNGEATRQDGISTTWNWNMSARTSMTAGAAYARTRSLLNGREDEDVTLRIGLAHQFQPKLRGGAELRRLDRSSTAAASDFRENAVMAFLQMSF
jgi:uncharacterized protein (PEP-CTERM system associated)